MTYIRSKAINAVEYDPKSGYLEIQFRSQLKWYSFRHVPEHIYQGLITASSAGDYYNQHIRGRYS